MLGLINGVIGFTFKEMPGNLHCPILVDGSSSPIPARSGRITSAVGEKPIKTSIESWPWLVHMDSIDEYDDYGTSNLGCMGSILTSKWILTSAKCCTYMGCDKNQFGCDPSKNRIVTGKQKAAFEDLFFAQETDHEPSQAIIHPQDSFQYM